MLTVIAKFFLLIALVDSVGEPTNCVPTTDTFTWETKCKTPSLILPENLTHSKENI